MARRIGTVTPTADTTFVQMLDLGGAGLHVGIKDSIDIAGFATRCGSAVLADAPPAIRHAAVVQTLLDAGCHIVGKTNMHELAYGVTGINRWSGTPLNPRFPTLVPGGSSSGSATAVASGAVDFGVGTDTGGSIRVPAACCGIYGFKPTYGRVSRMGVHPSRSSLDCVGPFARDLDMLDVAMRSIDPTYRDAPPMDAVRLGVVTVVADTGVDVRLCAGLQTAGVTAVPVELASFQDAFAAGLTLIAAENWAALGHWIDHPDLGPDVRTRLRAASEVSADAVTAAERVRMRFQAEVDAVLARVDALTLPTLPCFPLTLREAGDAAASLRTTAFVRPFNLSGHPAMSMPLGPQDAPPVGMQLIGRRGADSHLFAVARCIEARRSEARPVGADISRSPVNQ